MDSIFLPLSIAFWLGILTSISPCPLAANIAAISYLGNKVDQPKKVMLSGLLYTMGRMLSYMVIGIIIVSSVLSISTVSRFLQSEMNKILGPLLILIGLLLLDMLSFSLTSYSPGEKIQKRADKLGIWGAGLLGILFALSFCPISAALFFGSLIPLAIEHNSKFLMTTVYGVGTALPVSIFAIVIAYGVKYTGKLFNRLTLMEKYAKKITGIVFIIVGIYYSLRYIFKLF